MIRGAQRVRALARGPVSAVCRFDRDLHRRQRQAALPPAHQFQIDLRGQLGIEQSTMLFARARSMLKRLHSSSRE